MLFKRISSCTHFGCILFLLIIENCRATLNNNVSGATENSLPYLASIRSDDLTKMEWLAKLFDHHTWQIESVQNVSHVCKEHIAVYLQELKWDTSWANKMNDASGRYNGQYFFGNEFWLGSSTLCWELGNPKTNIVVPPFPVHFSVAKVELDLGGRPDPASPRQLMISFCLPSSCRPVDVKAVLKSEADRWSATVQHSLGLSGITSGGSGDAEAEAEASNSTVNVDVLDIRPVPGDYDILKDIKFYIVGGFALGVTILVCISTLFEFWLRSRIKDQTKVIDDELENSQTNNNNELKNVDNGTNGSDKLDKLEQRKKDYITKGIVSRLLLCFSALSNGTKILEVDKLPQNSIKCVHGLRFLSVAWVILVHTYLQVFAIAENKTLRIITERFFIYQTISNATFSVDSFFFISGLLVTILYFRTARQKQTIDNHHGQLSAILDSVKKFLLLVFYRVVRLTPAYLFVLGIHEIVIRYQHNTSVFEPNFYDHVTCDNYWWRNALYINTWYPQREICMLWSWYMSNDTQFYILAVFILLIAVRGDSYLKLAAGIVIGFLFASWITTFVIAYRYDYHARIEDPFALFDQLYDKPWMRIGPYLVGMVTGWIIFKVDSKIRIHWTIVTAAWCASIAVLLSLVYGVGKEGLRVPISAIYAALGHTAWGIALAWITFACCTGHGGCIESLLSFRGFLPFSRLTYCAYLVHPMIMCVTSFQMDGPIHLHNGLVLVIYFGNVVVAFLLSFLISLGFEAPVVRLLKIIMGGRSKDD